MVRESNIIDTIYRAEKLSNKPTDYCLGMNHFYSSVFLTGSTLDNGVVIFVNYDGHKVQTKIKYDELYKILKNGSFKDGETRVSYEMKFIKKGSEVYIEVVD